MPFGHTNNPSIFQTLINDVFVSVYLDNILIFSQTVEEHQEHQVQSVLQPLQRLYPKAEKCKRHSFWVMCLKAADEDKVKAVAGWQTSTSKKQLQQFLGCPNFYCNFIWNYNQIASPLTQLTSSKVPFC